ncbi:alpha/beta fold hydrolase domain-containing protein [Jannaschia ovalis]|uniref:Alpha/beta hydrolase n=1 Tax=Jannaschia ovalis TaxID=3038773 RepID=A0ABY8LAG8_9RHOB|nr:hypothetical protein [Jannaschia sp. GRR-S6-38]WGH77144.1 hypothetical protein P8627_08715 [Jannaschia sp. GRR-S6-38]
MAQAIQTVLRDDALVLRFLKGQGSRLVVVFTGIGAGFGDRRLDEFAASASDGGANNVLFVTDRAASWYAAPGLWDRIVDLIRATCEHEATTELVTLGNSMGGYGAMLAARDLPVARAIAFSPQVTMDRDLLADARWPDVAAKFGPLPIRSTAELVGQGETRFFVAVGGDCAPDRAHVDLLPAHPNLHRFVLPVAAHNLARSLKEAGQLSQIIAAIIRGRTRRVTTIFNRYARGVAA